MGKVERCTLTDAELEALGVEIPADETDAGLFEWIDNMIKEVFEGEEKKSDAEE